MLLSLLGVVGEYLETVYNSHIANNWRFCCRSAQTLAEMRYQQSMQFSHVVAQHRVVGRATQDSATSLQVCQKSALHCVFAVAFTRGAVGENQFSEAIGQHRKLRILSDAGFLQVIFEYNLPIASDYRCRAV